MAISDSADKRQIPRATFHVEVSASSDHNSIFYD